MIEKLKSRLETRKKELKRVKSFRNSIEDKKSFPASYTFGRSVELENEIEFLEGIIEGNNNLSREG